MPGPPPKPAAQRRRRNPVVPGRTLRAVPAAKAPELPFDASSATLAWWSDVWASPMAPEFDRSDVHGLFVLARLVDGFWDAVDADAARALAAEIRLQSQRFGLSPLDRRRLQWNIELAEEAVAKTAARKAAPPAAKKRADPRLKAV